MMHQDPEKGARAEREEINKREEPGVGELLASSWKDGADQAPKDTNRRDERQQQQQAAGVLLVIYFRLMNRNRVVAHGFTPLSS